MDIKDYKKFFIYQFIVIAAGTVVGLYVYNDVLKMHWSRRNNPYYGQMKWNPLTEQEIVDIKKQLYIAKQQY